MLMKEIQGNLIPWREMPYSFIKRLDMVNIQVLPKVFYRLKAIPAKISSSGLQTKTFSNRTQNGSVLTNKMK
jgi:hypothetical protein